MRYIQPEKVVRGHAKTNIIPCWDVAIMCFHSVEKTRQIVDFFKGIPIGYRLFSKCDCNMVFQTQIGNCIVGILGWCTGGGPLVASLIEELTVTGVQWIIGIGAAASLKVELKKNTLIFPTKLIVNDGLSKCYTDQKMIQIDDIMKDIVLKTMQHEKINFSEVTGATVEALYRQDENMLSPLRNQGAEVVNWELTPLYAVTKCYGIHGIWLGHISDIECNEIWDDWFEDRNQAFLQCVIFSNALMREISRSKE